MRRERERVREKPTAAVSFFVSSWNLLSVFVSTPNRRRCLPASFPPAPPAPGAVLARLLGGRVDWSAAPRSGESRFVTAGLGPFPLAPDSSIVDAAAALSASASMMLLLRQVELAASTCRTRGEKEESVLRVSRCRRRHAGRLLSKRVRGLPTLRIRERLWRAPCRRKKEDARQPLQHEGNGTPELDITTLQAKLTAHLHGIHSLLRSFLRLFTFYSGPASPLFS